MAEFSFTELLPLAHDETPYRKVSDGGISRHLAFGRNFLEVDPQALTLLTTTAMRDIAHLLRPAHLSQLRSILDDPEASPNDRYVARDLLQNACIAAGGILPMCQDTGTAIVMGKRAFRFRGGKRGVPPGGDGDVLWSVEGDADRPRPGVVGG